MDDPYLQSNRALWDEWAEVNARSEFYRVEEFKRGRSKLRAYEVDEVGPVVGTTLLHLQCHFGMDTRSWAREGAPGAGGGCRGGAIEGFEQVTSSLLGASTHLSR